FSMTQTLAGAADLSVTMFANPSPVLSGSNLTHSITVSNAGPNAAQNVTLTDTVPAGTTFQSVTPAACSTPPLHGAGTITCGLGQVASGAKATFVVVVKVTAASGSVSNTVTVSSPTSDPNGANNSATTIANIVASGTISGSVCAGAVANPCAAGN